MDTYNTDYVHSAKEICLLDVMIVTIDQYFSLFKNVLDELYVKWGSTNTTGTFMFEISHIRCEVDS